MLTRSALIAVTLAPLTTVLAAPFPGWAADRTAAVTLRYAHDETRTPEGARTLALRIRIAAAEVCGGDDILLRSSQRFRHCLNETLDRAASDLGSPMVARALGRQLGETTAARR
jgi:UrcA family protein